MTMAKWQDGTLSIEEIQKGIAESAVEMPSDLIEIMLRGEGTGREPPEPPREPHREPALPVVNCHSFGSVRKCF